MKTFGKVLVVIGAIGMYAILLVVENCSDFSFISFLVATLIDFLVMYGGILFIEEGTMREKDRAWRKMQREIRRREAERKKEFFVEMVKNEMLEELWIKD